MEKSARVSTAPTARQIEAMRETSSTIDGILSGVCAALHDQPGIPAEVIQLLMIGAAKAEILTGDLAALTRPALARH